MEMEQIKDTEEKFKNEALKMNSTKLLEQRPRSSGFKSFLNWFKKVESMQRNAEGDSSSNISSSEDDESDTSTSSTATVASFAFLPANVYKPYGDGNQPEKFIAPGPYTETYRRLIMERNRRRNLDKNLSLRKKYSLYSSGTLNEKSKTKHNVIKKGNQSNNFENDQTYDTFSLPSIVKKGSNDLETFIDNRRTASLSTRVPNCHVQGKRRAPPPPTNQGFTRSSNRKKRPAPPPPKQTFQNNQGQENILEEMQVTVNTTNHSVNKLEDKRETNDQKNNFVYPKGELSPRPWYKRQSSENKVKPKANKNDSTKKKSKHEYPEISFFRYSKIFETKKPILVDNTTEQENKQDKRASCLLPNISELDREAAEIIKHKRNFENDLNNGDASQEIKPSSARDLINKFNALTNANKDVSQSNVSSKNNEKQNISTSPVDHLISRKFPKSITQNKTKIQSNEQATSNNENVPNGKKNCKACRKLNTTSGNICINCINTQLNATSSSTEKENKNSNLKNIHEQSFQAEVFSAIPNFNYPLNKISNESSPVKKEHPINQKKVNELDEKIKLREMLKEMKNSLPKRPKPERNKTNLNLELKVENNQPENKSAEKLVINSDKDNNALAMVIKTGQVSAIADKFTSNDGEIANKNDLERKNEANDKLKNLDINKLKDTVVNKVSSSSQTTRNQINKKAESTPHTPHNDIVEKITKNNKEVNTTVQIYTNVEESKILVPNEKSNDQINVNTKLLLKQLESAIAQGNDLLAAKLAKDLALLKVNCSVTSTNTILCNQNNKRSIEIYIEDQFSHRGPILLRIEETIKIADLKQQVFDELHIPTGVQRWIIGKQLSTDDNLPLVHYNKNNFDNPLFLYIVAPDPKQEKNKNSGSNKDLISREILKTDAKNVIISQLEKAKNNLSNDNNNQRAALKLDEKSIENVKKVQVNIKYTNQPSTSKILATNEPPTMKDVVKKTWICSSCTLINSLLSPLCSACGSRKTESPEIISKNIIHPAGKTHYLQLVKLENADLVPYKEQFECPICLSDCNPSNGVVLRECLHTFCKECLANLVRYSEEAEIKCPYRDKKYSCDCVIQEREIKALVNKTLYEQHLAKSVNVAENKTKNAFHCKTPDCKGWCIYEENVNDFKCPVCKKTNCLTCQAIHEGKNCKEYQEETNNNESNASADGQRTKQMLEEMVSRGEAMVCPSCQVVLMKKWGCDWLRCSMCKTEICWVTRGARWGPAGKGDTSGGCQCGINGVKCHPKCNYCH